MTGVFSQMVSGRKSDRVDYVFCLDDSGSIGNDDFNTMKYATEEMLTSIKGDNQYAIVTFHSQAEIVSDFDTPVNSFTKLRAYVRKSGSTNLNAGLEQCKSLFDKRRPGATTQLIIITDGDYSGVNPGDLALKLRLSGVLIIVVGVGSGVNESKARDICNAGCFFSVNNFLDLKSFLTNISPTEQTIPKEFSADLSFTGCKESPETLSLGRFKLKFDISNTGLKVLPVGTRLFVKETPFISSSTYVLTEDIPPNDEAINLLLNFRLKETQDFQQISETLPFSLTHPNNSVITSGNIKLKSEWFLRPLTTFVPEKNFAKYNFMMFGIAGSGKSLFINRLLTACSSHIQNGAVFGGDTGHNTKTIQKFDAPANLGVRITLWDTWGLDSNNYTAAVLTSVLKGEVPPDYSMAQDSVRESLNYVGDKQEEWQRKVHCLLMFIPAGILKQPDLFTRMRQNYSYATSVNINPIIIVTRADTLLENEKQKLKEMLSEQWKVPQNCFFLIKNYTDETEKNFAMDMSSLQILQQALQRAEGFVRYHLKEPEKNSTPAATQYPTSTPTPTPTPTPNPNLNASCKFCSHPNVQEGTFCSNCGKKAEKVVQNNSCKFCSHPNVQEGTFCSNCGKKAEKVVQNSCKFCSHPNVLEGTFCSNCGKKSGGNVCPQCSTPHLGTGIFCASCGFRFN